MMDTKGQESGTLQGIVMAILLVCVLAVTSISFLGGLASNYNVAYNESKFTAFNRTAELTGTVDNLQDKLQLNSTQSSEYDVISLIITGGWTAINIFWQVPLIALGLFYDMNLALGLPSIFAVLATTFVIILAIFAIIAIIMKVRA